MSRSASPTLISALLNDTGGSKMSTSSISLCSTTILSDSSEGSDLGSLSCFEESLAKTHPPKPVHPLATDAAVSSSILDSPLLQFAIEGLLTSQISTFACFRFSPIQKFIIVMYQIGKQIHSRSIDYEDENSDYYDDQPVSSFLPCPNLIDHSSNSTSRQGENLLWTNPWLHSVILTFSSLIPLYLPPNQSFLISFLFLYTQQNQQNTATSHTRCARKALQTLAPCALLFLLGETIAAI
ncbi:hypothetical protein TrVE_jg5935 [Triparma verrucosa]|uniref:Uncharacterized protein n=1 Tax=Triparma verrucosa TaxID=1606542 RepID=A0A9W7BAW1_9STRA|nr:hypothetical protein TrVE_jg5935 [Triparma verrucosa]